MIYGVYLSTRFLHAGGKHVGPIEGAHCSHDGWIARLVGCRSECGRPTKSNWAVQLGESDFPIRIYAYNMYYVKCILIVGSSSSVAIHIMI